MEKYSSPHLRLHKSGAKGAASHPPGGMSHVEGAGGHPGGEDLGDKKTEPHPASGVHEVHIKHHGGGKFSVHTFHGPGQQGAPEHHNDAASVHNDILAKFPTSEGDDKQHSQNALNESYADGGSLANMSALGGE
jgi:hypothetical protein